MRAHVIEDGKVVNTIEVESLDFLPNLIDADLGGKIGDLWDGHRFAAPAQDVDLLKAEKNAEINAARLAANRSHFTYLDKQIACDELSRGDIDGVAGHIALFGTFPPGFPNAWKAMDNTYISLPDIASFKAMYGAMTEQGNANFAHAQQLKQDLAAATTVEEINAVVW